MDARSPSSESTTGAVAASVPSNGWLWLPLALLAMGFGVMHVFLDAGVRIFDLRGDLDVPEFAMVLGISLIQVWFVICFLAGTHRRIGGILGIAILCFLWVGMTNGYPIVYCPPTCKEAYPLSDVAHLGALIVGPLAGVARSGDSSSSGGRGSRCSGCCH